MAHLVGPEEFAVVRTVEATLNVLLIAASLGMPLLAVKTIAELPDEQAQGRMLGTLLVVSLLGGLVTAALASIAAGVLDPISAGYLRELSWVMALSACSRTCLNYFQGRREVHRMSRYTVILSLISLAVLILAVRAAGLSGWVIGRYVTEAVFLWLLVWRVGPALSFSGRMPGNNSLRSLLTAGGGIATSLLVRTAADNTGLYVLTFAGFPAATVGYFGLSSLVLIALSIVPASIVSIALSRIVSRLADPAALRWFLRRVAIWSLAIAVGLAGAAGLLARPAVTFFFPSYEPAVPLLWLLLAVVPFRALSGLAGIVLVACDRVRLTVWVNVFTLVVTIAGAAQATSVWGAAGTATAVVVAEVITAVIYVTIAWTNLPRLEVAMPPQKGNDSV